MYKKTFNIIQTNNDLEDIEEINILENNIVNTKTKIYPQRDINRDNIPNQVPPELLNVNIDDNNNNIVGSLIGKTSNDKSIKKYVKIRLNYVPNSEILDENNNITNIAFFSDKMINSIPYNFDLEGSYIYELYKPDGNTLINNLEGNWYIDNEAGLLVFNSNMNINIENNNINYIDKNNCPLITFYSYNGGLGLYPLTYNESNEIKIMSNLNVNDNLIIKENIVTGGIYLNNNNVLPNSNINNILINKSNELYFGYENSWFKILNESSLYSFEYFIYNIDNTILDITKRVSFIDITSTLSANINITLPDVVENGIEKTIIIGPSITTYIDEYNIIIRGYFIDLNCNGPSIMDVYFNKTGQCIKLVSVIGSDESYWQIIIDNSDKIKIIHTTENDLFINNYENVVYNPLELNTIHMDSFVSFIDVPVTTTSSNDMFIILPDTISSGVKKFIVFGDSINNVLDENGFIIIYGTFINNVGVGPVKMNLKFYNTGQSINIISVIDDNNNHYWQIISGHYECTDLFTIQNDIYINDSIDSNIDSIASQIQPVASSNITENVTYEEIILPTGVLEYTIDVELYTKNTIVIQLSSYLTNNVSIILKNYIHNGNEIFITMGYTINKYINNFDIILTSKFLVSTNNDQGPDYHDIHFTKSGNFIQLISVVNKNVDLFLYKERYWTLITGTFNESNLNYNMVDEETNESEILNYRFNELLDFELLIYDSLNYNIITNNKKTTLIELTEPLNSDIYFIFPNNTDIGFYKYIILGSSVSKYINNHNIIIYSKYITPEGTGPVFMNIRMNMSGQSLYVMSLKKDNTETNDNNSNNTNYYWQIINGHFFVNDYINLISDNLYINHNTNEIYNGIVDPLYSVTINTNIGVFSSLNIAGSVAASSIDSTQLTSSEMISNNINVDNTAAIKELKNDKFVSEYSTLYINDANSINNDENSSIVLKLNNNLTENKTLDLDNTSDIGLKKTLMFDDTISTYINNNIIEVKSHFLGSNTNNDINFNSDNHNNISTFNITKSGQVINLMSMLSENNKNYWFVI